ncbi:MAG: polyprenyl synthetase family protein [Burkholderiales bacterium]|nr:polyprenyl synthetase family protein [Bacteroidia bacterium]
MQAYAPLIKLLKKAVEEQQHALNSSLPKEMYEPMSYIIGLGGKRVRPLLTLIGCDLFGADPQEAIFSALAVELFHNFSLMHDDVLDKAPLRRGSTTVHEKWSENIALLSGDGLLVKSYQALNKSNPVKVPELLKLFSKTAVEVCEGQQMDMNFETWDKVSIENYIEMITNKTAVLLGCSLGMGAICANASAMQQEHVYEFGKHVGIAFQILDDVLDVYADDQKFGKQVGGDIIANKKTFLLLGAYELANESETKELDHLFYSQEILHSEKIKQVTAIYNQTHVKELAINEANKHTDIALKHLGELEADISKKNNLKTFALDLLKREA